MLVTGVMLFIQLSAVFQTSDPAQGNQSLSRELRASALCPGLEAQFPACRREERASGTCHVKRVYKILKPGQTDLIT